MCRSLRKGGGSFSGCFGLFCQKNCLAVHAPNLLCRLPKPRAFLESLPSLLLPGGLVDRFLCCSCCQPAKYCLSLNKAKAPVDSPSQPLHVAGSLCLGLIVQRCLHLGRQISLWSLGRPCNDDVFYPKYLLCSVKCSFLVISSVTICLLGSYFMLVPYHLQQIHGSAFPPARRIGSVDTSVPAAMRWPPLTVWRPGCRWQSNRLLSIFTFTLYCILYLWIHLLMVNWWSAVSYRLLAKMMCACKVLATCIFWFDWLPVKNAQHHFCRFLYKQRHAL